LPFATLQSPAQRWNASHVQRTVVAWLATVHLRVAGIAGRFEGPAGRRDLHLDGP
jgi:hypothetical protein